MEGPQEIQELGRAFNEMSQQVISSQQSQRDFVANVSHELKTPLTSIQGFAQAILDGTASSPEALQKSSQIIYDESGRMHRLVVDLLDLAKLDAGTADLQRAARVTDGNGSASNGDLTAADQVIRVERHLFDREVGAEQGVDEIRDSRELKHVEWVTRGKTAVFPSESEIVDLRRLTPRRGCQQHGARDDDRDLQ